MICQIMLNDIDKNSFNTIKLDLYNDNGINDYLLDEINNLKQTGKKDFAERYCVLL